ncbi:LysE family translocator [Pectobacterium sp. A5351]|uniref:LysE family translocator n=1 Tax=Pectobacterium sp. A5351 TaxID=2914983 RepID=UPI00232C9BDD|nr:LysE family translocator [Pectobacterium sp. A5351]WCG82567.1 LysE family translocator [Pectobacterium sp. A5351]
MEIDILGFIPALLPIALSPGASFTLAMNSAISGGRRGLLKTLAGTALGIYTHATLIGLGITAILVASPAIFNILKIAGTAYLFWLGIQLISSGMKNQRVECNGNVLTFTLKEAYLANVFNPKAVMFYLTVVSQFAGASGHMVNYLILASVHILIMGTWLVAVSNAFVFSAKKADPIMLKKYVNVGGGVLLIFFSLSNVIC